MMVRIPNQESLEYLDSLEEIFPGLFSMGFFPDSTVSVIISRFSNSNAVSEH